MPFVAIVEYLLTFQKVAQQCYVERGRSQILYFNLFKKIKYYIKSYSSPSFLSYYTFHKISPSFLMFRIYHLYLFFYPLPFSHFTSIPNPSYSSSFLFFQSCFFLKFSALKFLASMF